MVGAEPRDVTVRNRLLGRGSYVLVRNGAGELLVSKRSSKKVRELHGSSQTADSFLGFGTFGLCASAFSFTAVRD